MGRRAQHSARDPVRRVRDCREPKDRQDHRAPKDRRDHRVRVRHSSCLGCHDLVRRRRDCRAPKDRRVHRVRTVR
ncbi:MAG: hypothetical protein QGG36_15320 [Pirellulaceae bacterium]|nr:hypothetical protein [Pirellulaceae bacterium]